MNRYRATQNFVFGELEGWFPESSYQKISKDEIIGELEDNVGLYLKNQVIGGIELGELQLDYLTYVDNVPDPVNAGASAIRKRK